MEEIQLHRAGDGREDKKKWRAACALTDTAIGNQCQPLNESAVVDELSHSGRYLLDCCSDTCRTVTDD